MAIKFKKTTPYNEWFKEQTAKNKLQVDKRFASVEKNGEKAMGDWKPVGEKGVAEFRWKNGRRVYFAKQESSNDEETLCLLLGGNKNGQSQDIKAAEKILTCGPTEHKEEPKSRADGSQPDGDSEG